MHAQLASFIQVNSKNAPNIEPLQVPRPSRVQAVSDTPTVASHDEIMRLAKEGGAL
jgi:hypothetical protein